MKIINYLLALLLAALVIGCTTHKPPPSKDPLAVLYKTHPGHKTICTAESDVGEDAQMWSCYHYE